jgi:hypothetical protein
VAVELVVMDTLDRYQVEELLLELRHHSLVDLCHLRPAAVAVAET